MNSPHPTASDLTEARQRFAREARWHSFQAIRYRLQYADWGIGSVIVIVHGMCDTTESFCMLMAELVDRGYRCIGYELPNGRHDGALLGKYQHQHYAGDLVELLNHLKLDCVDIVGSSFGTTITLRSLSLYPNRFRRAVLKGGFARRPLRRIERGLARLGRYWPWLMSDLPIRNTVMRRFEKDQFVNCPDELFQFLLECSGRSQIRAVARRALIIDKLDMRSLLGNIQHPILMIGGDRDAIVPRQYEVEVERGAPRVRRVEFSPCGHYPQYTMPVATAMEIDDFFK